MTRSLMLALLSTTILIPAAARADVIPAEGSKIVAATVYADRATVEREVTLPLPAGAHTVTFSGLPLTMMPDSVRASGKSLAPVTFGAVLSKQVAAEEITAPKVKELNGQLDLLLDQQRGLNGEKEALAAKKAFLTKLGEEAAKRTNENIADMNLKPEQWTESAKTLFENINQTIADDIAVDAKLRELDKSVQKIQADINDLGAGNYASYSVSIPLEVKNPTQLTMRLQYQVTNAGWTPTYDARVSTESAKVNLIQYGAVRQQTGEDWSGIALTLSTAQPQRGTSLPPVSPFWVDLIPEQRYAPQPFAGVPNGAMMKSAAMDSVEAEKSVAMAPPPAPAMQEATFQTAQIETGGFVSEYKIPGPASMTADGSETKVMIGSFPTESAMEIRLQPQVSTDAFLVAETTLKGDSPILPGDVSLFRDGAYVGKSSLPLMRPDESFPLYFGTDDQISVKRKTLADEKKDAGVILRDNMQERHFVTEIQNLRTKPVTIVLDETTPVGRNDDVSSEIVKSATDGGYVQDPDHIKGLLRWTFKLDAKAKKDIKLGWKVTWPKDRDVSGL